MSSRAAALAVGLVVAGTAALAGAASADDKAEASRHFDAGVADAKAGAYREALGEFQRAFELSPNFAVLYNVAKAQAALGDAAAALGSFERYLDRGGAAIPPDRRARVAAEMKSLEPLTGTIVARVSPAAARVTLDGAPIDAAVAARGVRANVGARKLAAAHEGYLPVEQTVDVESGRAATVSLELVPSPADASPAVPAPKLTMIPTPPPEPDEPGPPPKELVIPEHPAGWPWRQAGIVLGVARLVSFATAAVLYVRARSDLQSAIDAGCTQISCDGPGKTHWQDAQDGVRNTRIAAGVGGALVVGGAVLFFAAPSGAGVSVAARW